jgi:hypothetical protein
MLKKIVGCLFVLLLAFWLVSCGDDGLGDGNSPDGNLPFAGELFLTDFMWDRTDSVPGYPEDGYLESMYSDWEQRGYAVVENASIKSPGSSYVPVSQSSVDNNIDNSVGNGVGIYWYSSSKGAVLSGKQYSNVGFNDIEFSGKFTAVLREPFNSDGKSFDKYYVKGVPVFGVSEVPSLDDKTAWWDWSPVRRLVSEDVSFKFPVGWDLRYVVPPGYIWRSENRFSIGLPGTAVRYSGISNYESWLGDSSKGVLYRGHSLGYWQLMAAVPDGKYLLHSVEPVVGVLKNEMGFSNYLTSSFENAGFYWNLNNTYYAVETEQGYKTSANFQGFEGNEQAYYDFIEKMKVFVRSVNIGNKVLLAREDILTVSFSESVPEGYKVYEGLLMGHIPPGYTSLEGVTESFSVGALEHYYLIGTSDLDIKTLMAQDLKKYNGASLSFDVSKVVKSFEDRVSSDYFKDSQSYVPDFEKRGLLYNGPNQKDGVWDGVSYVYDLDSFNASAKSYRWSEYVYTKEDWRSEKFPLRVMIYILKDE